MKKKKTLHLKENIGNNLITSICYIWWIEMKNTIKDEGMLIFFILVPLVYPLLYSWIYNNEVVREIPVVIIDQSHSATSREFIRMFDAAPDVQVAYYCNNLSEAQNIIAQQKANGVLFFPEDFERTLNRGEQAHVSVYCNMSLMLAYKAIYQTSMAVSMEMGKERLKDSPLNITVRDEEIGTEPMVIAEEPIFNTTGGYGNSILPGVLILILQQTLLLGIGLSAGTARENNRYQDLVPISKHHNGILKIVLGKSLCYLMIYCVMAAYVLLAVPRFFNFTMLAQPLDLFKLLLPYLLAVIFFGMTISCLVRYRENVLLLIVFTSVPFLFLSGISWPQSNIPSEWESVSWLIPSTFGIRGFSRMASMGANIADVKTEVLGLWIQATLYFGVTCIVYRSQIIRARKHAVAQLMGMKEKIQREREKRKV